MPRQCYVAVVFVPCEKCVSAAGRRRQYWITYDCCWVFVCYKHLAITGWTDFEILCKLFYCAFEAFLFYAAGVLDDKLSSTQQKTHRHFHGMQSRDRWFLVNCVKFNWQNCFFISCLCHTAVCLIESGI